MQFEIKTYADFKTAVEKLCAHLALREISPDRVFDSKLVIHELIGNVLQHSNCAATFKAEIDGEFIGITVRGENAYQPPKQGACPPCLAERGRGLYLVDSFSAERTFTQEGEIFVRIRIED